jgi:multidrug resistance efflux pump
LSSADAKLDNEKAQNAVYEQNIDQLIATINDSENALEGLREAYEKNEQLVSQRNYLIAKCDEIISNWIM